MLLTEYSSKEKWYCPYVEEILAGITLDEIELNDNNYLKEGDDIVLMFSIDFCNVVYQKLLESNNKADIHIYLVALRVASYNSEFVLEGIHSRSNTFFLNRPVLFLLMFSRDNLFKYEILRQIYRDWHADT